MQTLPFSLPNYPYSLEEIQKRINQIINQELPFNNEEAYQTALHCIDLTTLEGSDTEQKVRELCQKAIKYNCAAVCVYPPFVALAKECLKNSKIRVASVAGAFPAGQSPIEIKVAEVKYAVEQGADEIDMVISRGKFLEGKFDEVYQEIVAIRKATGKSHLKVILETGELLTPDNIFKASYIAMKAGADFIKTSTGKIAINATYEAFIVMLDAINQYHKEENIEIGIKPAGGISDSTITLNYLKILHNTLGNRWLNNSLFRIGASRLADQLSKKMI